MAEQDTHVRVLGNVLERLTFDAVPIGQGRVIQDHHTAAKTHVRHASFRRRRQNAGCAIGDSVVDQVPHLLRHRDHRSGPSLRCVWGNRLGVAQAGQQREHSTCGGPLCHLHNIRPHVEAVCSVCGLALYGAGFVGELVVLGCVSTSVANPYSQKIRTRLPIGGYASAIAYSLACLPLLSHPYSALRGTTKPEGEIMDWKHLLAYIMGTVDQELLLRNEYLVTENRMLRHQLTGRMRLTDSERTILAA